jgi:hypothetical protein
VLILSTSAWQIFPSKSSTFEHIGARFWLLLVKQSSRTKNWSLRVNYTLCTWVWPRYFRGQWSMTLVWKIVYNFFPKKFFTETLVGILRTINKF